MSSDTQLGNGAGHRRERVAEQRALAEEPRRRGHDVGGLDPVGAQGIQRPAGGRSGAGPSPRAGARGTAVPTRRRRAPRSSTAGTRSALGGRRRRRATPRTRGGHGQEGQDQEQEAIEDPRAQDVRGGALDGGAQPSRQPPAVGVELGVAPHHAGHGQRVQGEGGDTGQREPSAAADAGTESHARESSGRESGREVQGQEAALERRHGG